MIQTPLCPSPFPYIMSLVRFGGYLSLSGTQSARLRPQISQVPVYQRSIWRPRARFASTLPNEPSASQKTRASLLEIPSKESLPEMEQDEGILLTAEQALINITPRAAEASQTLLQFNYTC